MLFPSRLQGMTCALVRSRRKSVNDKEKFLPYMCITWVLTYSDICAEGFLLLPKSLFAEPLVLLLRGRSVGLGKMSMSRSIAISCESSSYSMMVQYISSKPPFVRRWSCCLRVTVPCNVAALVYRNAAKDAFAV